jgi:hypothetical protein
MGRRKGKGKGKMKCFLGTGKAVAEGKDVPSRLSKNGDKAPSRHG